MTTEAGFDPSDPRPGDRFTIDGADGVVVRVLPDRALVKWRHERTGVVWNDARSYFAAWAQARP